MQISRLPARTGLRWVIDGFRVVRRQPLALTAISFLNLALMGLSMIIPIVGSLGPLVLTPLFMVGMMKAARMADQGQSPSPLTLFAAFRDDSGRAWKPLMVLGAINAAATIAAMAAAAAVGGEALFEAITGRMTPNGPQADDATLLAAAGVFLIIYLPVQLATWYAPLFIAWDRVPLLKSMFFSIAAILRNKWAFLAYAFGWLGFAVLATLGLRILATMMSGSPLLLSLVLTPLWLIGLTAVYCSFWVTYRDAVDLAGPQRTPEASDRDPTP